MSRALELLEGDNNRLSMRALCTYIVTFTLCIGIIVCLGRSPSDGGTALGLAGILSTLIGIIYGVGKFVDGSVTKASMPSAQPVNVENVETVNVESTSIKRGKNAKP